MTCARVYWSILIQRRKNRERKQYVRFRLSLDDTGLWIIRCVIFIILLYTYYRSWICHVQDKSNSWKFNLKNSTLWFLTLKFLRHKDCWWQLSWVVMPRSEVKRMGQTDRQTIQKASEGMLSYLSRQLELSMTGMKGWSTDSICYVNLKWHKDQTSESRGMTMSDQRGNRSQQPETCLRRRQGQHLSWDGLRPCLTLVLSFVLFCFG